MTQSERKRMELLLWGLMQDEHVKEMKQYVQHGRISTYDHCVSVAQAAFELNQRFHFGADERILMTGAMLHDFYLYDWHNKDDGEHRLHGYHHADRARENAVKYFSVDPFVQHIIHCHMWPLNITRLPRTREAWIVCLADKWCSFRETVFMR